MSALALREFMLPRDKLEGIQDNDAKDCLVWAWEKDGDFSAKSAYQKLFGGCQRWPSACTIWRSKESMICKVFGWLAARDRCWTADGLGRQGLPSQAT